MNTVIATILSLTEATKRQQAAQRSIDAKQAEIATLTAQAERLDTKAQAATGADRDRLDSEFITKQRQIERAKGDLPALQAAKDETDQLVFEARYVQLERDFRAAQDNASAVNEEIAGIEAQIAEIQTRLMAANERKEKAQQTARGFYQAIRHQEQAYVTEHAGADSYISDLRLRVHNQLYKEEEEAPQPESMLYRPRA